MSNINTNDVSKLTIFSKYLNKNVENEKIEPNQDSPTKLSNYNRLLPKNTGKKEQVSINQSINDFPTMRTSKKQETVSTILEDNDTSSQFKLDKLNSHHQPFRCFDKTNITNREQNSNKSNGYNKISKFNHIFGDVANDESMKFDTTRNKRYMDRLTSNLKISVMNKKVNTEAEDPASASASVSVSVCASVADSVSQNCGKKSNFRPAKQNED